MKKILKSFIIFCIIGCSGSLIHLGITYILTEYIGLYYMLSYYIGFCVGIINNFMLNKYFNFKDKSNSIKQFIFSISIYFITSILSGILVYFLTDTVGLYYLLSSIITIPVVAALNFILHKFIVFK